MADLAATNVTLTNAAGEAFTLADLTIVGRSKRGVVKIAFGNGALTYPSGGVPMPAIGAFGMLRDLNMKVYSGEAGIQWDYDKTNNKLRGYIPGVVVSAAGSATLDDYPLNPTSDALTSAQSISLGNSAGAGTYYLGKMKELGGGPTGSQAPAATTLYAEIWGW